MKTLYIQDELHAKLKRDAKTNGRTLTWWVDTLLHQVPLYPGNIVTASSEAIQESDFRGGPATFDELKSQFDTPTWIPQGPEGKIVYSPKGFKNEDEALMSAFKEPVRPIPKEELIPVEKPVSPELGRTRSAILADIRRLETDYKEEAAMCQDEGTAIKLELAFAKEMEALETELQEVTI